MVHARQCFLCGNPPNQEIFRSMTRMNRDVLLVWRKSIAVTLSNLLNLDETYETIFQKARFCKKCLEAVLGAEFATKSIARFQSQLEMLRQDAESYFTRKYEDIIQQGAGGDAEQLHTSIGDIIRQIDLALETDNMHFPIKEEHSDFGNESDLDQEFITPHLVYNEVIKTRKGRSKGKRQATSQLDEEEGAKLQKRAKRTHVRDSLPSTSSAAKIKQSICSRSGRKLGNNRASDVDSYQKDSEPAPVKKLDPKGKRKKAPTTKIPQEFQCPLCKLPFMSTLLMEEHLTENHKFIYDLKCQICSKGFEEVGNLGEHEGLHNLETPSTCVICNLECIDPQRLIRHVQSTHEGKTFWCNFEFCLQNFVVFPCSGAMKTHLSEEHGLEGEAGDGSLYHCTECPSRYSQLRYLNLHERKHTEKPTVPCEICDKIFYTQRRMKRHLKNIHTAIQMLPKCTFCALTVEFAETMTEHEALHSNETPFDCVLCGAKLSTTADLRRHVQRTHEILPFKCEVEECGRSFETSRKLKNHQYTAHCTDKPHKCSYCPFRSLGKANLKTHMLSHTKEAGFLCPVAGCERRFVYKQAVDKHVLHFHKIGNKKLLICKVCGKEFRDGIKLKEHEVYHANLRSFMCELCSATFKTKKDLLGHVKLHDHQNQIKEATPRKSRLQAIRTVLPEVIGS